jgi:hypothetical protein
MIRTIEDGLVKVTGTAAIFCGQWSRCRARIPHVCRLSGKAIVVGDLVYRPVTNGFDRHNRVLADVMEKHAASDDRLFGGKK